ncbi:hypothetical protein AB0C07_40250, partial [Actinoplanes missouriensis]|uniref:hypothetical protein n=1 Tax=Actinoplanes missouriensis TaxID=1866 RepID=UPI0033EA08BD
PSAAWDAPTQASRPFLPARTTARGGQPSLAQASRPFYLRARRLAEASRSRRRFPERFACLGYGSRAPHATSLELISASAW